jgi:hypothetical protein
VNVVKLHEQPPFTDIGGRLRRLADQIEDPENHQPRTVLTVIYQHDGTVTTRCFGDNPPRCEVLGLLQMAAANILEEP